MKLSLVIGSILLVVECGKDASSNLGSGTPTFLTPRPRKVCFRRVKKKPSKDGSTNQKPHVDNTTKPKDNQEISNEINDGELTKDDVGKPKIRTKRGAEDDSEESNEIPHGDSKNTYKEPSPKKDQKVYDGSRELPQDSDKSKTNNYEESPPKNKDVYDSSRKRTIPFNPRPPPPDKCTPNFSNYDLNLKKKPPAPKKSYDVKDMDVQYMLDMVNHARGDKPLRLNDKLMQTAKVHADWLAANNKLEHMGEGGSMPCNRCKKNGYFPNTCGENISNYKTDEEAMQKWLGSCGHYENIMHPKYTEFGVWRSGDKWVQVFGEGDSEFDSSITTSCDSGDTSLPTKNLPSYNTNQVPVPNQQTMSTNQIPSPNLQSFGTNQIPSSNQQPIATNHNTLNQQAFSTTKVSAPIQQSISNNRASTSGISNFI